jgi:SPP1 gp7 family putative phage head morphogenesis protein
MLTSDERASKRERNAAAWRRIMRAVMIPNERRMRRVLIAYLRELFARQVKLINRLRNSRAVERGPGDVLFDREEFDRLLRKRTEDVYLQTILGASESGLDELGVNIGFDTTDDRVIEILEGRQASLVKANVTIQRQLARLIERGAREGRSIREIQETVRTAFKFSAARSLTIARTEIGGAVNEARFAVLDAEGVESHAWATSRDEAVRETHSAQDGAVVRVGVPFPNGLLYPGDLSGPAAETINCRCVAVPEL